MNDFIVLWLRSDESSDFRERYVHIDAIKQFEALPWPSNGARVYVDQWYEADCNIHRITNDIDLRRQGLAIQPLDLSATR